MINKTKISLLLLLPTIIQTAWADVIPSYQPHEYESTCLLPYWYDDYGTAWTLLGKERRGSGDVWFDFCGKKDRRDINSWETAWREALEETADQLQQRDQGEIFMHRGDNGTVHYVTPAQYIDPNIIGQAKEKLRGTSEWRHVEKMEWRWVKIEELLNRTTGLNLYWLFKRKLQKQELRQTLKNLSQYFKELPADLR